MEDDSGAARRRIGLLVGGAITAALVSYTWKDRSVHIDQISAVCGTEREVPEEPTTTIWVDVKDHDADIHIEQYWFYCDPTLHLDAVFLNSQITLEAERPDAPDSSCLCPYSVVVRAKSLPSGDYNARVNLNVRGREEFAVARFTVR